MFLSYVLSFVYLGIYWNNHHHMLHTVREVSGPMPAALYGVVLLMDAIAYYILQQLIIASQGPDSILKKAVRGDWKGKLSPVLYAIAIPMAFWSTWISLGLYVLVALIWLVPDRRIESVLIHKT